MQHLPLANRLRGQTFAVFLPPPIPARAAVAARFCWRCAEYSRHAVLRSKRYSGTVYTCTRFNIAEPTPGNGCIVWPNQNFLQHGRHIVRLISPSSQPAHTDHGYDFWRRPRGEGFSYDGQVLGLSSTKYVMRNYFGSKNNDSSYNNTRQKKQHKEGCISTCGSRKTTQHVY